MRFYLALYFSKFAYFFIKSFNLGAGFTWPGHIALKIYPDILSSKKIRFKKGVIFVTGTNGKTTTSKIISHVLEKNKYKVLNNTSGANLENGVVSSILLKMNLFGKTNCDFGVFEIDEMNLSIVMSKLKPNYLILLNLSRDQLDRYGETDYIFSSWERALSDVPDFVNIVLYKDEPKFNTLARAHSLRTLFFDSSDKYLHATRLIGSHNAKNANAAYCVLENYDISEQNFIESLSDFKLAYGRGEEITYLNKIFKVFLAKNPSSFNSNLEILSSSKFKEYAVFILLNDNIPDGRDISWIYDINSTKLYASLNSKEIFIGGTRCWDMAIRLHYAGLNVEKENISENTQKLIDKISREEQVTNIVVLPNYSAMLDFRKLVLGRKIL